MTHAPAETVPRPAVDNRHSGHRDRLVTKQQEGRFTSPWSRKTKVKRVLWQAVRLLLFRPSPKKMVGWRRFLLRLFGARIEGRPFVSESAIINMPWHLTMEDKACLGPHAEAYALGPIVLKRRCTVAQHAYLCTGTHDLEDPELPLVTGEIVVGEECFVGVRALVLPGVHLGDGSVVGAGAVVTRDVEPWTIVGGNPAKPIKRRTMGARATGG